ncbi:MAG: AAA family ATPase [Clostridia bacterium]|nr:AAA family ATPase [Clostridia bacterium]
MNVLGQVKKEEDYSEKSKTVSLFEFIRELNKLKRKTILDTKDYPWTYEISKLPEDPENVKLCYCDRVYGESENDVDGDDTILLSVHKPEFQPCPEPDKVFIEWLLPGWKNYRDEPSVKEYILLMADDDTQEDVSSDISIKNDNEPTRIQYFEDDSERVLEYNNWRVIRSEWAQKQKIVAQTRDLFSDLYRLFFELQRESETEEMIVANGILHDSENPLINHPVLTHRVKIEYDADSNTIFIIDTDTPSELYSAVFGALDDANLSGINALMDDLKTKDYHPLDRNDTPIFLKTLVHQLSSSSFFSEQPVVSDDDNRLILYLNPCFIVRRRLDGSLKAIERIIEDIQETGSVPKPIVDIVSGGTIEIPDDIGEETIEERLAAVGGESVDILLSKEANKEQLDIAKRIESYNAVVVQGPPGTGKTHTIANLMGHFLAQGKSVLVTSHTKKALSVLKEKVVTGLQDLCVSLLDDSNVDMERAVSGITDFTSRHTSFEIKREMDGLAAERRDIISELADVRKRIFAIINQECSCIVLNGEDISPSKAAEFVTTHMEELSYIPGNVRLYSPLPLSYDQLSDLYRSNEMVNATDEKELETGLPNPTSIMTPSDFATLCEQLQYTRKQIKHINNENSWIVESNVSEQVISFSGKIGDFSIPWPSLKAIEDLKQFAMSFGRIDQWMKVVAVDGKSGKAYRQRWQDLIKEIMDTCGCADEYVKHSLGKNVVVEESFSFDSLWDAYEKMHSVLSQKGKLGKIFFLRHRDCEHALSAVTINGVPPQSLDDFSLILFYFELQNARRRCRAVWDELLMPNGVPGFDELDKSEPERIAVNLIPQIEKYLNWFRTDYELLISKLAALRIPSDVLFQKDILDSELAATNKILTCVERTIPQICEECILIIKKEKYSSSLKELKSKLVSGKRGNSNTCKSLVWAIDKGDLSAYADAYASLEKLYGKYTLQSNRNNALKMLESRAPQWADAIRNRQGVHGSSSVPSSIEEAWKWKQLCGIIEEITEKPFTELQADSLRLSREYRRVTAKYAEMSGWYHLLRRTEADINMKQALEGWRLTIKSIGKGTGKRAPMLKAKARELMVQCQNAVPCWIMPISKALENLDPRMNKFDIVIIDEASQADLSSLAILYMGKKLVVVGDDRQVSPMAVGVESEKIDSLYEQYIKNKIPNDHLYTAKSSIYDIAKTTFQSLMLREHFRCVPEIIGFSNMLSYDGKIKPLRDASDSVLLPAVVNYRVSGGQRVGKTNPKEAEMIVALMQACFDQPEYDEKTFGIISLLGDDQVKLIQQELEQKLKPQDIIRRNVLCGNSANFQGDERDIIFLSLVDSGDGSGPLKMLNYGPDDTYRKRYNVAASRARDQLWVVDSLDSTSDLKPGDIRKRLIDYSLNPKAVEVAHAEIEKKADSPFETAVAIFLADRGYHLVQQWQVGSYRLDIVAVCGKKKVAIECDGEKWHSGEEKIREDMERQTILERLGWRFIRIRGSEFYRDSEKTMERVISELADYGIEPEDVDAVNTTGRETELLKRIKARAYLILEGKSEIQPEQDVDTIAVALNPSSLGSDSELIEKTDIPSESKEITSDVDFNRPDDSIKTDAGIHSESGVSQNNTIVQQDSAKKETYLEGDKTTSKQSMGKSLKEASSLNATSKANPGIKADKRSKSDTPKTKKKDTKTTDGKDFLELLRAHHAEFVDNRKQSSIVWILYDKEKKALIESTIREFGFKSSLEKRGAIATGNRPAWRVMI